MSTRRARIKAVASLPIRRKNTGAADKTKQVAKDSSEKTKSPRTPRAIKIQEDEKKSPYIKTAYPSPLPGSLVSTVNDNKPESEKSHELDSKTSPDDSYIGRITPLRAEKVSVITPNFNYKHTSPHASSRFASPCVPSPKASRNAGVIVQRTTTEGKTPATHTIDENNELQISSRNVNAVVYNSASSKSVASDDYHVPSVPDSADNDGVMDGIVPLQAKVNMPKPIDVLKSEIISENAEVLFDPIIPLPSPSKVRPKLRPAPRLGPHRRSSVQGSASESEDENRRALNGGANTPGLGRQRHDSHSMPNRAASRARNDSVCSTASQQTSQANATSPLKERNLASMRRQEVSRRMAAARRRRETLKRDKLTMYDLIFYNPITNPIVPNPDEIEAKEQSLKDEVERVKQVEEKRAEKAQEPESAAPVPQIKLGPNGEIILDKSSLVIKQTDSGREVSSVVREGAWGGGGGRYSRASRTAEWSAGETVRFYRALAALGTDFSLMASLFPGRTRRDLKLKFKKEEKLNGGQVDKALRSATAWDVSRLKEEFTEERAEAARKAQRDAERARADKRAEQERLKKLREMRVRNSRASKALENTMLPGVSSQKPGEIITADDIIDRSLRSRAKQRQSSQDASKNLRDLPKTPQFATLTLLNGQKADKDDHDTTPNGGSMATLSKVTTPVPIYTNMNTTVNSNTLPNVPSNIESGSLVVLTVNDPSSPAKKMLQTYIAHRAGRLTPVSLPPDFLNSVVDYMKKGTPKSTVSSGSSPQLTSPSSVISQDSPNKRQRMSSYTITQL